jgi:hypothetical protein
VRGSPKDSFASACRGCTPAHCPEASGEIWPQVFRCSTGNPIQRYGTNRKCRCYNIDKFIPEWYLIPNFREAAMKGILGIGLLALAGTAMGSVIIGSPEIPSMDPFCGA